MALLVEYKCEQTIPKDITIQHKIYQAYKDESNISMQDIKTSERQREREQSQTREICFEVRAPLLYVPAFNTMKDFHYKPIPPDHSVPQHLQGVHTRILGLTSRSLVPSRTTHRKHTSLSRPHIYTSSHQSSKQREPASPPPQIQNRTLW